MKRISRRSAFVFLIALAVIFGMGVFLNEYRTDGEDWALYFSRSNSGASGSITDRNGVVLAAFDSVSSTYNDDAETRIANYHVTGDYWGRTGTGLLTVYGKDFTDYSVLTGTTKAESVNMQLTIDSYLNTVAYEAIGSGRKGAIMVMNYKTGEVLVMASAPSVDPLDADSEPADGAYINRCISASFTPGSVFKLITSAAAIETISPESRTYYCEGSYDIAGVEITCPEEHWTQTFDEALANSCNIAFSQITVSVGQTAMVEHVSEYGFLSRHTLDDIPTAAGSYPTDFVGDPELAWSGIGQSTDLVCPYTLLRYVAAIANDGVLVEPTLFAANDSQPTQQLIAESTAHELASMMANDVAAHYEPYYNFPGLDLSAKTGTAEIGDGTTHAWFAGYLNSDEYPYAFVVIIENGGGGLSVAGAAANTVLQAAVNR